jgi:uroporphyrinogen III methyltransferase/synthase
MGTIVHRQIIECVEMKDTTEITKAIQDAARHDWIVFTSGNGIKFFFKKTYALGLDARVFSKTKFAVIGKASGERLQEFGIKADICAANESSTGVLEAFSNVDVNGLSILLPQAKVSSEELPTGLLNRGARVEKLVVYQTIEKEIDDVNLDYINQVLFTSGSTVKAFVNKFGTLPKHIQALCLGIPTQNTAKQHNIDAVIIDKNTD